MVSHQVHFFLQTNRNNNFAFYVVAFTLTRKRASDPKPNVLFFNLVLYFQVLVTNLELEPVAHLEPANFWIGPSAVSLLKKNI